MNTLAIIVPVLNHITGKASIFRVFKTTLTISESPDELCDDAKKMIALLCYETCQDITVRNIISFTPNTEDDGDNIGVVLYNPAL
jgi:hypothetical protein